ncbi:hypothetical protein DL96DRAFT_1560379 [Flagelloscypha sp. PMI_526]|nr:hypothetical protein DL96DRAFT_1560379 [Flagelloscypha sp. PMI_526]
MPYTFTNYDVQNSAIIPSDEKSGTIGYRITTERRSIIDSPKRTVIYKTGADGQLKEGEPQVILAKIEFKEEKMEVGGVSKTFAEVKQRVGGTFSSTLHWKWDKNGKKYEIKVKKGDFFAREVGKTELVATYEPFKLKPMGKYVLGKMTFHQELSESDQTWLWVALMFYDLEIPAKQRPLTFKEAAGGAALSVAGTIAGNAVGWRNGRNLCLPSVFPIDTIKTRLQAPQDFLEAGGFRGIYCGIGSAACLVRIPTEVIKTRAQTSSHNTSDSASLIAA